MKIGLSLILAVLIIGCSSETSNQEKEKTVHTEAHTEVHKELRTEPVKKTEATKKTEIKKEAKKEVKKTEVSKSVAQKATPKKELTEQQTSVKTAPVVEKKIDGAKLFSKCTSCHGTNAEKQALNKSQVIKGWEKEKIITAINGYIDGSYGSSMKGVMKPQVSKLSKEEIEAVASYISNL